MLAGLEGDPLRLLPGPQERGELPLELACELSGSRMVLGARGGVLSSSSANPIPCMSSDKQTATSTQQRVLTSIALVKTAAGLRKLEWTTLAWQYLRR